MRWKNKKLKILGRIYFTLWRWQGEVDASWVNSSPSSSLDCSLSIWRFCAVSNVFSLTVHSHLIQQERSRIIKTQNWFIILLTLSLGLQDWWKRRDVRSLSAKLSCHLRFQNVRYLFTRPNLKFLMYVSHVCV